MITRIQNSLNFKAIKPADNDTKKALSRGIVPEVSFLEEKHNSEPKQEGVISFVDALRRMETLAGTLGYRGDKKIVYNNQLGTFTLQDEKGKSIAQHYRGRQYDGVSAMNGLNEALQTKIDEEINRKRYDARVGTFYEFFA